MGGKSRRKGKVGELEVVRLLRAEGFDARRGQQHRGGPGSPDVIVEDLPFVHVEAKRTEAFRLYDALDQSRREAEDGKIPVVFHRRSRHRWVVVLDAHDFCKLAREYTD